MENYKELISEFKDSLGNEMYNQLIKNGILANVTELVTGTILLIIGLICVLRLYGDYKECVLTKT